MKANDSVALFEITGGLLLDISDRKDDVIGISHCFELNCWLVDA